MEVSGRTPAPGVPGSSWQPGPRISWRARDPPGQIASRPRRRPVDRRDTRSSAIYRRIVQSLPHRGIIRRAFRVVEKSSRTTMIDLAVPATPVLHPMTREITPTTDACHNGTSPARFGHERRPLF